MIVGENTCDGKKKAYESLAGLVDNLYVMDLPQVKHENGRALLKVEYNAFQGSHGEALPAFSITADSVEGRRSGRSMPNVQPCIGCQRCARQIRRRFQVWTPCWPTRCFFTTIQPGLPIR
jgi:hypothetical protein